MVSPPERKRVEERARRRSPGRPSRRGWACALATLALGAGCAVRTDGAPCHGDAQCPSGQRCAAEGVCTAGDPLHPASRLRALPLELGEPASPPAIDATGRVLLSGRSGAALVVTPDPVGGAATLEKVPLGLTGTVAAPASGPGGAWFTSPATLTVGLVRDDGSSSAFTCTADDPKGAGILAATTPSGSKWAFAPGGASSKKERVYALSPANGACRGSNVGVQITTPFVSLGGGLYAATASEDEVGISRFVVNEENGIVAVDSWAAPLRAGDYACDAVTAPLAVDASRRLVAVCGNGQLWMVDPARGSGAAAVYLRTFEGELSGSPLGLAGGEVVVATGGTLRKYAPLTTREQAFTPPGGSKVNGYLASNAGPSKVSLYAVTDRGGLFALDADLAVVWSMALGGAALGEPTIAPAAGLPGALPTLYVVAADGKLYAVAVDAGLDDDAPWPKGRRDAANSGGLAP